MRILEQLKLEWTDADLQAFRSMWMSRVPIPDIAERLGCSAAEVALLVIVEGTDGRQHVVRNERIGKKIAKREKKHAEGFDRKRVGAYGKAPDKRAIHHITTVVRNQ